MTTRADGVNSIALDHFPVCPRCGDVCGRLARICVECGTALFSSDVDLAAARAVGSPVMTAEHREAEPSREGKAI